MTQTAQLVNSLSITQWFPKINGTAIERDNFLDLIDESFSKGNRVIIIEGEEGSGKSILLSQYARRNENSVFLLFIGSKCAWDYDAMNLLDDLHRQIYFYLNHTVLHPDIQFDLIQLRQILRNLVYTLSVKNQNAIIIIDGIDQIPCESVGNADIIIDNLPLTNSNIKILLSTRSKDNSVINKIKNIVDATPIVLTGFSLLETKEFFRDIDRLNDKQIGYIHNTFKSPRQLSLIKDKLSNCDNTDVCIESLSDDLVSFLEKEWSTSDVNTHETTIISILCIDSSTREIDDISSITNIPVEEIKVTIEKSKYLIFDSDRNFIWFKSELYKKLFANILRIEIEDMKQKILSYYLSNNDFSNVMIPTLMLSSGKAEDVILYMSFENMVKILNASNSYAVLLDNIECALLAADKCGKDSDSLRYSLIKSIINDTGHTSALLDEVDALFSLNKIEDAINLAQTPFTIEDRLLLLSRVAKKQADSDIAIDSGVYEQIKELSARINYRHIKEKAIDIASEIIHFQPDLAIDIIERSSGESTELENELDFAFARLSFERMVSNKYRDDDVFANINSKITSKSLRNVTRGLKYLFKDYSAADLIDEVKKLDSISEKVLLLRHWIRINRRHQAAVEIIDYIIELANSASDYKPDSDLYYDIARPLPYAKDKDSVMRLIKWFENNEDTIKISSSIRDFVNIKSTIYMAEAKHDYKDIFGKILSLYYYISDIGDIVIKTECLSIVLNNYDEYYIDEATEKKEGLRDIINNDMQTYINDIIKNTADHYKSFRRTIKLLSPKYYDIVKTIICKINTKQRKNRCYLIAFNSYIENIEPDQYNNDTISNCFECIDDDEMQASALYNFIETLSKQKIDKEHHKPLWIFTYKKNEKIKASSIRTKIYSFLMTNNDDIVSSDILWSIMLDSWNSIELYTEKVETGFVIVSQLSDKYRDRCQELYQEIKELENSIIFKNTDTFRNYTYHLQNAIRAISGLIHNDLYREDDIKDIGTLIEHIPSCCIRARVWNELALRYFLNEKNKEGIEIVKAHIIPIIEDTRLSNQISLHKTMIYLLVSVYKYNSLYAYGALSKMPDKYKDDAIIKICNYILYSALPTDPIDPVNKYSNEQSIADYYSLIKLAYETSFDYSCYSIITDIIDSIEQHKRLFNRNQLADICSKINELINEKFPTPNCISHEGYKIISLAQLNRLDKNIDLKKLMQQANLSVDNTADLVYIYAVLGELTSDIRLRNEICLLAENLIERIQSVHDRIEHLELLGYHLWYKDKARSKKFFEAAILVTKCSSDVECIDSQKSLIEIVSRLDDEYAKSLLDMIDNDSSRIEARKAAIRQKENLALKKSLSHGEDITVNELNPEKYNSFANMAWNLLGQFNARGIMPISYQNIKKYYCHIRNMDSHDQYPVFAWIIENLNRQYAATDSASSFIRPCFDNIIIGLKYMIKILHKDSIDLLKRESEASAIYDECIVIKAQERRKAIDYIIQFVSRCCSKKILICDKYFSPSCLDILYEINKYKNDFKYYILTSHSQQNSFIKENSLKDEYNDYWRKNISIDVFPEIELIIVIANKNFPFHDRFLACGDQVINIGTSLNSLGVNSVSQMSVIKNEAADIIIDEMHQYINRHRSVAGREVEYIVYTL